MEKNSDLSQEIFCLMSHYTQRGYSLFCNILHLL